jgi:hypothetical protein
MKYAFGMVRLLAFLLLACSLFAANYKLHLREGGFHVVREHKVIEDRVRYYSVERGDWEEIPVALVDLAKTEKELKARADALAEEKQIVAEEAAALRELRKIVASIPEEPGVYKIIDGKMTALKVAESAMVTDKKRQVLKVLTPIPIVAGKSTIELAGTTSATVFSERRPEFYIRLSTVQQFGLVVLTPNEKRKSRIVETVQVIPVSKELFEERQELEIFRQQLGEGLYKIWAQEDMPVGEYAWLEFTEGKANPQIWDFRIQ